MATQYTHTHIHTLTWIHPERRGWNEMKWNHVMLCYHVMSARVVYGLATWPYPKSEICRYVFTPMLSGLRWPGHGPVSFSAGLWRGTWCSSVCVHGSWVSPSDVCCFACSNMYNKPKEVSPVPLKKADKSNHCTRVTGCSVSNQRPTEKAGITV